MIERRPFNRLGQAGNDWLKAGHHFSFAGYHDPKRTNCGSLVVWNDDAIASLAGTPPRGQADMEITTSARSGVITHEDTLDSCGCAEAGDGQVISPGSTRTGWAPSLSPRDESRSMACSSAGPRSGSSQSRMPNSRRWTSQVDALHLATELLTS